MNMQLQQPGAHATMDERALMAELLPLAHSRILELGCGRAELALAVAREHPRAHITALEVDRAQHALNLAASAPANLRFAPGGAEAIAAADGSFDVVWMLKSLHHVPAALLGSAIDEVRRVLVRGGLFYVSEPVFAGEFNEIVRIFHDEEKVRLAAFDALRAAVADGRFELVAERFFDARRRFDGFAEFERGVIGVTHTRHRLTDAQFAAVRERFMRHATPAGAVFLQPMRVDLLRKPG